MPDAAGTDDEDDYDPDDPDFAIVEMPWYVFAARCDTCYDACLHWKAPMQEPWFITQKGLLICGQCAGLHYEKVPMCEGDLLP